MVGNLSLKRTAILVALGLGLFGSFLLGVAYAADVRLHQANGHVNQAIVLLEAAENPGVDRPFGGHRTKALKWLDKAQLQIDLAIDFADNPK